MLAKHLAMALVGTALISAPALAQSQPAGQGGSMTQMQPGQWRASKLDGLNVYNNNNEKIGDISEMIVDQSGKIQAVVVGVGGFLGIGQRDVAIPFEQVKFVNEPRANATTANNTTTGSAGMSGGSAGTGGAAGTNTANNTMGTAGAGGTAGNTTGSVATNAGGGASPNTGGNNDSMNRSAPDHAMVNMTREQLQGMPEFKYSNQ